MTFFSILIGFLCNDASVDSAIANLCRWRKNCAKEVITASNTGIIICDKLSVGVAAVVEIPHQTAGIRDDLFAIVISIETGNEIGKTVNAGIFHIHIYDQCGRCRYGNVKNPLMITSADFRCGHIEIMILA